MLKRLVLNSPVEERPLEEWGPISALLLGTQTRIVQGERWHHRVIEKGDGPPLFMYHGVGGHSETYARSFEALSKHFHVYAVDALFHGFSGKEGFVKEKMYDLLADGFADLVHALGYEKVHFEGESMGGMFGINVGFRYPELVDKMINNSGFFLFNDFGGKEFLPSKHVFDGELAELSVNAVLDPSYENIKRRLEWLVAKPDRMPDEMIQIRQALYSEPEINASMRKVFNVGGDFSAADWPYTEEDLKNFPVKDVLIIWGEYNPGRGIDFGEYCAELMGATFYGVEDAGHWPQWEKPEEYCAAIIQFLNS